MALAGTSLGGSSNGAIDATFVQWVDNVPQTVIEQISRNQALHATRMSTSYILPLTALRVGAACRKFP